MNDKHLGLLAVAFFCCIERREDGEYGSIGLDCKRPFGNGDVESDILEIIGVEPTGDDGDGPCWSSNQRKYAAGLYNELPKYLQRKFLKIIPKRFKWRFAKKA